MKQRMTNPNGTPGHFNAPISAAGGNVPNAYRRPLVT
jgi:hypothetical protein